MGRLRAPLVALALAFTPACAPVDAPASPDDTSPSAATEDDPASPVMSAVAKDATEQGRRPLPDVAPDADENADGASVDPSGPADTSDTSPVNLGKLPGVVERLGLSEEHEARIEQVQALVHQHAAARGLDVDLVNGLIWVESNFNPRARGPAGAMGLMQLMPKTARGIGKRLDRRARPYDPDFNLDAGTWLLRRMLDKADGNERHALIAYNRGWAYVGRRRESGEPFSPNVEAYVDKVLRAREAFARSRFSAAAAQHPGASAPAVAAEAAPEGS